MEEANGLLDFIGPLLTELSDYSVRQEMLEEIDKNKTIEIVRDYGRSER